ncbi:MAG: hypothetical protein V1752_04945 [Candidatus Firestonebacteria bacterium]
MKSITIFWQSQSGNTFACVKAAANREKLKKCVGCCGCFNICPIGAWETPVYKKENFYKGEYAQDLIKTLNKKKGG